uniref:Uncharacterized protein n=1 Tax=Oncorhynchus tshawytscha TaxID=74940 RepID=A0AAZ3P9Z0_ONCTS
MDQHLRLTFLFQDAALHFIGLFSQCHSRMLDFLIELEKRAVKLEEMKFGSDISCVAGSAVGATGGALTIAGLCLAPVTAGLSLGLTIAGLGMGVTSGVNSLTTDSVSLTKGSKRSQLIRARAALWRTEIKSCQRIHDSLCRGIWRFRKSQRILEKTFYLIGEIETLDPPLEKMGLLEPPGKETENGIKLS